MNAKLILSTLFMGLMSMAAMAQKLELKAGETLNPGEAVFSQNGEWVLIMENSVPSGRYGQFATFATKGFSLARDTGIMSSEPKYSVGKANEKAQKLSLDGNGNLTLIDFESGKNLIQWNAQTLGRTSDPNTKAVKLVVENDGSVSLYNASNQKIYTLR